MALSALQAAVNKLSAHLDAFIPEPSAADVPDLSFAAPVATEGATYTWTPTIIDPVTGLVPSPDLSTYASGDFEVRQSPGSAPILQASTGNGQMTFGAVGSGQFTVTFQPAQLTTSGSFTWEAKFTDSTGVVSKPFGGQFTINQTFTS